MGNIHSIYKCLIGTYKILLRSGNGSTTVREKDFFFRELTTEDTKEILHKEHGGGFIYGKGIDRKKHRQ